MHISEGSLVDYRNVAHASQRVKVLQGCDGANDVTGMRIGLSPVNPDLCIAVENSGDSLQGFPRGLAPSTSDDLGGTTRQFSNCPPPPDPANPPAVILVVDDHPINRMVVHRQIDALGYAAEDVESGPEAFELWRTGKFSLVLTDLNMPIMSGYDLSILIREAEAEVDGRGRIPIIACSANVIPGVIQSCIDAGMDDYIAKPTQLLALSEKLTRWLPSRIGEFEAGTSLMSHVSDAAEDESTATI